MSTYLTPQEAAARLRSTIRQLMHLRTAGGGPRYIRIGRRVLYAEDEITAWLAARSFAHRAEETASLTGA